MNALTAEWVQKAEGDYATAGRKLRVRRLFVEDEEKYYGLPS